MTAVAVEVVLLAEAKYRDSLVRRYDWRVKRRAELKEEEERKRKLEAEQAERERIKRMEQGRIDGLLTDAAYFQQAAAIREYVANIQCAQSSSPTVSVEELQGWRDWALAQADRIDPSIRGTFARSMLAEHS